ncbi:Zinc finger BED domain containing protein 1, partial [Dissostichus eleginoides]
VIVKDMRPLSLVEGEAFIDMIEYACPGFKCPSRWWFTKQLEKAYQRVLDDLKGNLKKRSSKITLTTDAWTSIATEAYLGVTCHYINENWEMLIVDHALKEPRINKALGAARSLVTYFHSSEVATLKLKLKQEKMGTPQHKLSQDVPIRWNSSFYMIKRLLEQRWPVTATLSDPEVTKAAKHYLDMRADQWSILGDLHQALEPFEQATVFLSGEAYVTVSVLPPLVKGLQKYTQKAFESAPIATFQTAAAVEIASRWKVETTYDEDGKNVSIFAAALDPRFRKLKFLSTDDILKLDHSRGQKPKSVLDTLLGSDEEEEMEDDDPAHDQREDAVRNEVLLYFGGKAIPKDKNPLQWWKENETKFPSLAVVAKSYLAAPATSTPSERLFSAAGTIVSKKRASLTKEHVDMLTFLHSNSK